MKNIIVIYLSLLIAFSQSSFLSAEDLAEWKDVEKNWNDLKNKIQSNTHELQKYDEDDKPL